MAVHEVLTARRGQIAARSIRAGRDRRAVPGELGG